MSDEIKKMLKTLGIEDLNPAAYCGYWIEGGEML